MENMSIRNVDKDTKRKALFVLKMDGKTMSDAVRETLEKYAREFDTIIKK